MDSRSIAIIAAGALIGLGIYAGGGEPRYTIVGAGQNAYRLDTTNGAMMNCVSTGCYSVAYDPAPQSAPQPQPQPQPAPTQ